MPQAEVDSLEWNLHCLFKPPSQIAQTNLLSQKKVPHSNTNLPLYPIPSFAPGWEVPQKIGGEVEWDLTLNKFKSQWGSCERLRSEGQSFSSGILSEEWHGSSWVHLNQGFLNVKETHFQDLDFKLDWSYASTNALPHFSLDCLGLDLKNQDGSAQSLRLHIDADPPDQKPDLQWALPEWNKFLPLPFFKSPFKNTGFKNTRRCSRD